MIKTPFLVLLLTFPFLSYCAIFLFVCVNWILLCVTAFTVFIIFCIFLVYFTFLDSNVFCSTTPMIVNLLAGRSSSLSLKSSALEIFIFSIFLKSAEWGPRIWQGEKQPSALSWEKPSPPFHLTHFLLICNYCSTILKTQKRCLRMKVVTVRTKIRVKAKVKNIRVRTKVR